VGLEVTSPDLHQAAPASHQYARCRVACAPSHAHKPPTPQRQLLVSTKQALSATHVSSCINLGAGQVATLGVASCHWQRLFQSIKGAAHGAQQPSTFVVAARFFVPTSALNVPIVSFIEAASLSRWENSGMGHEQRRGGSEV
jgi:hypothetical protein